MVKGFALIGIVGILLSGCGPDETCTKHGGVLTVRGKGGDQNVIVVCRDGYGIQVQS